MCPCTKFPMQNIPKQSYRQRVARFHRSLGPKTKGGRPGLRVKAVDRAADAFQSSNDLRTSAGAGTRGRI